MTHVSLSSYRNYNNFVRNGVRKLIGEGYFKARSVRGIRDLNNADGIYHKFKIIFLISVEFLPFRQNVSLEELSRKDIQLLDIGHSEFACSIELINFLNYLGAINLSIDCKQACESLRKMLEKGFVVRDCFECLLDILESPVSIEDSQQSNRFRFFNRVASQSDKKWNLLQEALLRKENGRTTPLDRKYLEAFKKIEEFIKEIKEGEPVVFAAKNKIHAVLYQLERQKNNYYTIRIVDSCGMMEEIGAISPSRTESRPTQMLFQEIPEERFQNKDLYKLLSLLFCPDSEESMEEIYKQLIQVLGSPSFPDYSTNIQEWGTCPISSHLGWLDCSLHELEKKHLFYGIRQGLLNWHFEKLSILLSSNLPPGEQQESEELIKDLKERFFKHGLQTVSPLLIFKSLFHRSSIRDLAARVLNASRRVLLTLLLHENDSLLPEGNPEHSYENRLEIIDEFSKSASEKIGAHENGLEGVITDSAIQFFHYLS